MSLTGKTITQEEVQQFKLTQRAVVKQTERKKFVIDFRGNYQVHKKDGDGWLKHYDGPSERDAIQAYNELSKINFDD